MYDVFGAFGIPLYIESKQTADRLFGSDYVWSVLAAGRHQMPFAAQSTLLGGSVRGGIYGTAASLTPGHPTLENNSGDVRYETDFRSVYARLLDQWLGVNSVAILNGDFRAGAPAIF